MLSSRLFSSSSTSFDDVTTEVAPTFLVKVLTTLENTPVSLKIKSKTIDSYKKIGEKSLGISNAT